MDFWDPDHPLICGGHRSTKQSLSHTALIAAVSYLPVIVSFGRAENESSGQLGENKVRRKRL